MVDRTSCIECEIKTKDLLEDPRVPPLDTDYCLCSGCYVGASEERIEELEEEIAEIKTKLPKGE